MEIKTEADSNDITDYKPTIGMLHSYVSVSEKKLDPCTVSLLFT